MSKIILITKICEIDLDYFFICSFFRHDIFKNVKSYLRRINKFLLFFQYFFEAQVLIF